MTQSYSTLSSVLCVETRTVIDSKLRHTTHTPNLRTFYARHIMLEKGSEH